MLLNGHVQIVVSVTLSSVPAHFAYRKNRVMVKEVCGFCVNGLDLLGFCVSRPAGKYRSVQETTAVFFHFIVGIKPFGTSTEK